MSTPVKWVDSDGQEHSFDELFSIDDYSGSLITITQEHHNVHAGNAYSSDFVDETLGDDATIIIAFKTMSGLKRVHMVVEFSTLVGGDIQVWEGATWDTNTGTVLPVYNRKRDTNPKVSNLLEDKTSTPFFTRTGNILSNVTNLGTGSATSLRHFYSFGIQGRPVINGGGDFEELLLRPDTQYAVVFTADGASNKAQIMLSWSEY